MILMHFHSSRGKSSFYYKSFILRAFKPHLKFYKLTADIYFLFDTANEIMLVKQPNKKNFQKFNGVITPISQYLNNTQQNIGEYQTTQNNSASCFNSQLKNSQNKFKLGFGTLL